MSWVKYHNGNYDVLLNTEDGTKIRKNDLESLIPEFPESFDFKICNKCNMNCPMCHENSTSDGTCGDLRNAKFIDTIHPYTEIAIGGGNPLEHPDLYWFLLRCQELRLIPSMTVHQKHFMENLAFLRMLRDKKLIYGIGVSVSHVTPELIKALKEFPNAVVHIIAGIADETLLNKLRNHNLKILILGYKVLRRGKDLYDKEQRDIEFLIQYLYDLLPEIIKEGWFNTVSFDNLSIKQLNPGRLLTPEEYEQFFMGDDGSHTFYVDLVNNEFAVSSTAKDRFPLLDNIDDMFAKVREVSGHTAS